MRLYPSSAEEKLGFDLIRERLDAHARSRLGQVRLANMKPSSNPEWVRAELERVIELEQAFRFDDPVPLEHVLDIREVVRRVAPEGAFVSPEELLAVRLVLATLRRVRAYFEGRPSKYPRLVQAVARITPLPDVEARIAAAIDDEGRLRDDASPELRRLRRLLAQRQAQLRETLQQELRRAISQGWATEEQPTIRNGRMVIPVRAEARRRVEGFVQDLSATGQTAYVEPAACLDLNNEVREIEAEERREVERILREVTAALHARLDALRDNLKALAQFDLLQAKARMALEMDAVAPQLDPAGVVDIRRGRNALLLLRFARLRDETGEAREVVPLDLTLGDDYRTLVITGPNAGGKTVAMKTVGLFALMLAYGLPLPVDPLSRFPVFDHLIVDIGDEQSMEEDLSTFSSHVENLKYMLRHAGERTLVLIDEAGTGTDPAEGGALAQAVLERLTEAGARTIATTHHGTLKVFAHETEGVENGSMQFDQETLGPTYRFRARVPGSSYAFEIAARNGLQRPVLARARALVGRQKNALEDLIATFEARNQALEERLREAERQARQAAQEREAYETRHRELQERQEELRRRALEEAEGIVRAANARVERTIREIKEAQAERETTRQAREQLDRLRDELAARRQKAEERSRQLQARRPAAKPKAAATPKEEASTPIAVGDQVVLDGGTSVAEVVEIEGAFAGISFDSARLRVRLDRLQKVSGPRRRQVIVRQVQQGQTALTALNAHTSVDVRGMRVDEALHEVGYLVDRGVAAGIDRLEILHGKGTGALRQAIQDFLAASPDVASFEEAPWNQGGAGVTYVTLK